MAELPRWDLILAMSIPGQNSTAAMLVKAGFVAVLTLVNVSGFRSVLARGWHGVRRYGAGCVLVGGVGFTDGRGSPWAA